MTVISLLTVLLASQTLAASAQEAFIARQATPGSAACANLTTSLGDSKVISSQLNPEYIETRLDYWNEIQSEYAPSCIVYPTSANDVSIALQAVRAAESRFAIKAGGHNPNTFFSSVDQGVLLDMNSMTTRTYDASTQLGTYEPGGVFGDIYEYFIQYNRTVVGARLAGVGTGLALSGGLSYLSPQYGMACDSFRELEVVIPSGEIVTASETENPDLFFACRGGGGNAYGVVTKYTVQTRPAGTFTAGNLIFLFEQTDDVLNAVGNFTLYNTDPKASIIATYEKLLTPSLDLNLDESIILFLVYDGPDPGDVFNNFTSLDPLINTVSQMDYIEVINLPIPDSTLISRGDNIFRVQAHHISESDKTFATSYNTWVEWCENNKGSYVLSSIDFQPIGKTLTDASASQGGNAMQMPEGPWLWLNFLIQTPLGIPDAQYDAIQASFRDMVASVTSADDLPLFINDASYDQNPLQTFSTFDTLKATKMKYDPDSFFANYTGGWNFDA